MEETSESTALSRLTEDRRMLVELYARDPNVTKIAETLGVHRTTVHRRLDDEDVQEAILELRIKLDEDRNTRVEEAQDMALDLIELQLKEHLKHARENPGGSTIGDTQKIMQIAEKLGAMKKDVKKDAAAAIASARKQTGAVDWGSDPEEDV